MRKPSQFIVALCVLFLLAGISQAKTYSGTILLTDGEEYTNVIYKTDTRY